MHSSLANILKTVSVTFCLIMSKLRITFDHKVDDASKDGLVKVKSNLFDQIRGKLPYKRSQIVHVSKTQIKFYGM